MFQDLNEFYREAIERERKGKIPGIFAVIPFAILEDPGLSPMDKVVFGEISALANKFGFCYANNRHFQAILGCHLNTLHKSLKRLEEKGYIRNEVKKDKKGTFRKLWITCGKPVENPVDNLWKTQGGGSKKSDTGDYKVVIPKESTKRVIDILRKITKTKPVFGKEGSQEPV